MPWNAPEGEPAGVLKSAWASDGQLTIVASQRLGSWPQIRAAVPADGQQRPVRQNLCRASVRGQEHVIGVNAVAKRRPPGTESAGLQHLGSHVSRQGSQSHRTAHQLPSQRAHRTLPLGQDDN